MIPTQSASPLGWSGAISPVAAPAVAPVAAVPPVAPVQAAARDAQAGLSQRPPGARAATVSARDGALADAAAARQRQAEQERREAQFERLQRQRDHQNRTVERLREVLQSVWAASAAVVEPALQREAASGQQAPPAASPRPHPGLGVYASARDAADELPPAQLDRRA